jgi:hypothetical protein
MYHYAPGEHGEMRRAEQRERMDATRQERAEKIAREAPLPAAWRAGVDMTDALQDEIVAYGAACALQALTETENAA